LLPLGSGDRLATLGDHLRRGRSRDYQAVATPQHICALGPQAEYTHQQREAPFYYS